MKRTHSLRRTSEPSTSRPFFPKTSSEPGTPPFFPADRSGFVQRQTETSSEPEEKEEETVVQEKSQETSIQRMCAECEQEQSEKPAVQAKLSVGEAGDQYEQEADRVADQVVDHLQTAKAPSIQTKREPAFPAITPLVMRQGEGTAAASPHVEQGIQSTLGSGEALAPNIRHPMEQAFGADFSGVRIHTGGESDSLNRSLRSRAFTTGRDVFFKKGEYRPEGSDGQRLLAHELTHVVQQGAAMATSTIQRYCEDSDFCTPYPTRAEAASAEATLRSVYLPIEEIKFGPNSRALYESFLNRSPGDSLAPVEFNDPASDVVSSFADSWATADDQDAILDMIGDRLHLAPGGRPRPYTPTMMSISNFLTPAEMDNRPINYSNPLSIAGHIAGGIGSSDAGNDYRKVWGNVTLENTPLIGSTGYIKATTTLHYEVFDAIDFCPGDCGSPAEQLVTIPMSRLEAGGDAYDVPFKVTFIPDSRSKRFFYS